MLKRALACLLLALLLMVPFTAQAQDGAITVIIPDDSNPNLNISYPPAVYVVRGVVNVRGTANLTGMTSYFIEFLNLQDAPDVENSDAWVPATTPSRATVNNGVLGQWDTRITEDGLYALRVRAITASGTVDSIVSPIRVENQIPEFVAAEMTATASAGGGVVVNPPTPTLNIITRPTLAATPTAFSGVPTVTATTDANVRRGDNVSYDPVGFLLAGDSAQILGISPTGWYYIQLDNGRRGYVAPFLVSVSGNVSNLTVIPPPATPTPTFTPTPIPAGNLTINGDNVRGETGEDIGREPRCNRPFQIWVNVNNSGTQRTPIPAIVNITIYDQDSNTMLASINNTVPQLNPGENFLVTFPLVLGADKFPGRTHRVVATIDSNSAIAEENETDNVRVFTYFMRQALC